jgi:hypothetical protein
MVVSPLMEVDRASGARAFIVGFSNQYPMGRTSPSKKVQIFIDHRSVGLKEMEQRTSGGNMGKALSFVKKILQDLRKADEKNILSSEKPPFPEISLRALWLSLSFIPF